MAINDNTGLSKNAFDEVTIPPIKKSDDNIGINIKKEETTNTDNPDTDVNQYGNDVLTSTKDLYTKTTVNTSDGSNFSIAPGAFDDLELPDNRTYEEAVNLPSKAAIINTQLTSIISKGSTTIPYDPSLENEFDFKYSLGDDPYEIRANNQSNGIKYFNGYARIPMSTFGKMIDIIPMSAGFIADLATYKFSDRKYLLDYTFDNPALTYTHSIQKINEDWFPVYERESYRNADPFARLWMPEHSAKISDGVSFLLSMIGPNALIKSAGATLGLGKGSLKLMRGAEGLAEVEKVAQTTAKINRLTAMGKTEEALALSDELIKVAGDIKPLGKWEQKIYNYANKADDILPIHFYNVVSESAMEAEGQYNDPRWNKTEYDINPETGVKYTAKEIEELEELRHESTALTFKYNVAALMFTNIADSFYISSALTSSKKYLQKNLFAKGIEKLTKKKVAGVTAKEAVVEALDKTISKTGRSIFGRAVEKKWQIWGLNFANFLTAGLKTAAFESMEEGIQTGIQMGTLDGDFSLKEMYDRYLEGFHTFEGRESMYMGALIGFIPGGVGGVRTMVNKSNMRTAQAQFAQHKKSLLTSPIDPFHYKVDEKTGEKVYDTDDNGNRITNNFALSMSLSQMLNPTFHQSILMEAIKTGDKTLTREAIKLIMADNVLNSAFMIDGFMLEGAELDEFVEAFMENEFEKIEAVSLQNNNFDKEDFENYKKEEIKAVKEFTQNTVNLYKAQQQVIDNSNIKDKKLKDFITASVYDNILVAQVAGKLAEKYRNDLVKNKVTEMKDFNRAKYNALYQLVNNSEDFKNLSPITQEEYKKKLITAREELNAEITAANDKLEEGKEKQPLVKADTESIDYTTNKINKYLDNIMDVLVLEAEHMSAIHLSDVSNGYEIQKKAYDEYEKTSKEESLKEQEKDFTEQSTGFYNSLNNIIADKDGKFFKNGAKLSSFTITELKLRAKRLDYRSKKYIKKGMKNPKATAHYDNLMKHLNDAIALGKKEKREVYVNKPSKKALKSANTINAHSASVQAPTETNIFYTKIIDGEEVIFRRQSNFVDNPSTVDTFDKAVEEDIAKDKERKENDEGDNFNLVRGNAIDMLGKSIISGNTITYKDLKDAGLDVFADEETFDAFVEHFTAIRDLIVPDGGYVLSDSTFATLNHGNRVGGETDIIVVDKSGNVIIYDIKFTKVIDKEENAKNYAKQLGIYKSIIENVTGLKVIGTKILSIHAEQIIVGDEFKVEYNKDYTPEKSIIAVEADTKNNGITYDPADTKIDKKEIKKENEKTDKFNLKIYSDALINLMQRRNEVFNKLMKNEFIDKVAAIAEAKNGKPLTDKEKEQLKEFAEYIANITSGNLDLHLLGPESIRAFQEENKHLTVFKSNYNKFFIDLFNTIEKSEALLDFGADVTEQQQNLALVKKSIDSFIKDTFNEEDGLVVYGLIKEYLGDIESVIDNIADTGYGVRTSVAIAVHQQYNLAIKNLKLAEKDVKEIYDKIDGKIAEYMQNKLNNKEEFSNEDVQAILIAVYDELGKIDFTTFDTTQAYIDEVTRIANTYINLFNQAVAVQNINFSIAKLNVETVLAKLNDIHNLSININNITVLDEDFKIDIQTDIDFMRQRDSMNIWIAVMDGKYRDANGNYPFNYLPDGSIQFTTPEYAQLYQDLAKVTHGSKVKLDGNNVLVEIDNKWKHIGILNKPEYLETEIALLSTLQHLQETNAVKTLLNNAKVLKSKSIVTEDELEQLYLNTIKVLEANSDIFSSSIGDGSQLTTSVKTRLFDTTYNFKDSVRAGAYLLKVLQRGKINPHYLEGYKSDLKFYNDLQSGKITELKIKSTTSGSEVYLNDNGSNSLIEILSEETINNIINRTSDEFIGISLPDTNSIVNLFNDNQTYSHTEDFKAAGLYFITRGMDGKKTKIRIYNRYLNEKDNKFVTDKIKELTKLYKSGKHTREELLAIKDEIGEYITKYENVKVSKAKPLTYYNFDVDGGRLEIDVKGGRIEIDFSLNNDPTIKVSEKDADNDILNTEEITIDALEDKMLPILKSTVKNIEFERLINDLEYLENTIRNGDLVMNTAPVYDEKGNKIGLFQPGGNYPYTIRIMEDNNSAKYDGTVGDNAEKSTEDTDTSGFDFDTAEDEDDNTFDLTSMIPIEPKSLKRLNTINKEAATIWLEERLGKNARIKWVQEYMHKGNSIVEGMVKQSTVILGDYASFGAEFHEAFHIVFNNLITEAERAEVLAEAKIFYGIEDTAVLEEKLAEDYRLWEMNKLYMQKSLPQKILSFFINLLERINLITENTIVIKDLFERISNNEFSKDSSVRNNQYQNVYIQNGVETELPVVLNSIPGFNANQRISASELLTHIAIQMHTGRVNINQGLYVTKDGVKEPVPPINKMYSNITNGDILKNPNLDLKNILINQVIAKQKYLMRLANSGKISKQDIIPNLQFLNGVRADLESNTGTETLFNDVQHNLNKYHNLTFNTYEELSKMETEENYKLTKMFSESAFKESTERSFRLVTKSIIATGVEYTYNENGDLVPVLDEHTGLPKPINYDLVYPKLQDLLKNVTDVNDMRERMANIAKFYPTIAQYLDILKRGDEITLNQTINGITVPIKSTTIEAAWFTDFNKTVIDEIGVIVPIKTVIKPDANLSKLNLTYGELLANALHSAIYVKTVAQFVDEDEVIKFKGITNKFNTQFSAKLNILRDSDINDLNNTKFVDSSSKNLIYATADLLENYAKQLNIHSLTKNVILTYLNDGMFLGRTTGLEKLELIHSQLNLVLHNGEINHKAIKNLTAIIERYGNGQINYMYRDFENNPKYGITKHNMVSEVIAMIKNKSEEDVIKWVLNKQRADGVKYSNLFSINGSFSIIKVKPGVKIQYDNYGKPIYTPDMFMLDNNAVQSLAINLYAGLKKESTSAVESYLTQDDISWAYSTMALYAGSVREDFLKNDTIRTMFPILGDSNNHYVFSRKRLSLKQAELKFEKDGTIKISNKSAMYYALSNTIRQDLERIENALSIMFKNGVLKDKAVLDKMNLIENYHFIVDKKTGEKVYRKDGKLVGGVFKFGNIDTINFNDWFDNGILDSNHIKKHMQTYINEYITKIYNDSKHLYEPLEGSMKYQLGKDEGIYVSPYTNHKGKDAWQTLVLEQLLNTYLNNVEIQLAFTGTHASQSSYQQVTKRAKKAIQFAEQGINQSDFTNIVVNDRFVNNTTVTTLYNDLLRKALVGKMSEKEIDAKVDELLAPYQSKTNSSDGWSLMSLNHWVKTMKSFGKWSDVEHLLTFKDNKYSIRKNLSYEELKGLIQVLKPIYVENKLHDIKDENNNTVGTVNNYIYHKTSTFVPTELFAESNSEMSKVIDFMSSNRIDMITFKSSRKDGAVKVATIFDEQGAFNSAGFDINEYGETLNMKNFKLQLYVPDDIRDKKIKAGVQFYKHIIGNITDTDEYTVPSNVSLGTNGKITGAELKELHFDTFVNVIGRDAQKLFEELGGKYDAETGELVLANHNKLYNTFIQEAINRNFSANDKNSVTFDKVSDIENGEKLNSIEITSDFAFGSNNTRSKELFQSLFTNGIINTKMDGGHLVLLSEAFNQKASKFTNETTEVIEDENLKAYEEDGILYVETKVPIWSKDFIDEQGNIRDINTIDSKVLNLLGYRVPISSKHSMVVMKVVGFTETTSGSVVIPPAHLIKQTGWDFDVDSLFVMTPAHKVINGKIKYFKYNNLNYEQYALNRIHEIATNIPALNNLLGERYTLQQYIAENVIDRNKYFARMNAINSPELKQYINTSRRITELNTMLKTGNFINTDEIAVKAELDYLVRSIEGYEDLEEHKSYNDTTNNIIREINAENKQYKARIKEINAELIEELSDRKLLMSENEFIKSKNENINNVLSRKQLQNKLIDIWSLLLSQHNGLIERITPAAFNNNLKVRDDINNEIELLTGINPARPLNPANPADQIKIHNLIIDGKAMLNIAANSDATTTIFEHTKTTLREGIKIEYDISELETARLKYGDENIEIKDKTIIVNHNQLGWTRDGSNTSMENIKIIDNVAEDVDHSVDSASDPMIRNINITTFSSNVMSKTVGIKNRYIGNLVNQFAITKMLALKNETNNVTLYSERPTTMAERYILTEMAKILKLTGGFKFKQNGLIKGSLDVIKATINEVYTFDNSNVGFTEERLQELFEEQYKYFDINGDVASGGEVNDRFITDKLNFLNTQLRILNVYNTINDISNAAIAESSKLNADKLHAGGSFEAQADLIDAVNNPKEDPILLSNGKSLLSEVYLGDAYPLLKEYYEKGVVVPYNTLRKLYSTQSDIVREDLIKPFKEEFKTFNRNFDTHLKAFENHIMFHSLSEFRLFQGKPEDIYNKLGIKFNPASSNNLIAELLRLKLTEHAPMFVQYITYDTYRNTPGIVYLKTIEDLDKKLIPNIHTSITDMWDNGGKDREFVEKLVLYSYIAEGFGYGKNNISSIIPQTLLSRIGLTSINNKSTGYISKLLRASNANQVTYDYDLLIEDFLLTNVKNNKFVPAVSYDANYRGEIPFGKIMLEAIDKVKLTNDVAEFTVTKSKFIKETTDIQNARFIKFKHKEKVDGKILTTYEVFKRGEVTDTSLEVTYTKVDMTDYISNMHKPVVKTNTGDVANIFEMSDVYVEKNEDDC